MNGSSLHARGAFRCVTFLLLAFFAGTPLLAQLVSVLDFQAPADHSPIIGVVRRGTALAIVTREELYEAPLGSSYSGTPLNFVKQFSAADYIEGLDTNSSVALSPVSNNLVYTSIAAFAPAVVELEYVGAHHITVAAPPSTGLEPGTIAIDSAGSLYYFQSSLGLQKMAHGNYGSPIRSFGTAGPGTLASQSYGLAVAHNVVYVLDLPNHRIVRFDASTGDYLGDFAVTGEHDGSQIAVSGNGRLYLTNGNGGGNIYDAFTGATLDTFAAATGGVDIWGGRDAILLDDTTGQLFTFDPATGMHFFVDPAAVTAVPEPSTYAALAGLAGLAAALERRRASAKQRCFLWHGSPDP